MPGDFDFAGQQRQAIDNIGALTDIQRKRESYNALSSAYGPAVAYDPAGAFNAVKADTAKQSAPTEIAQGKANLQKTQLENTQEAGNQQRLAAYRATQMLKSVARPDGSVPQEAYDQIVRPNAGLLGIDPEHIDQFGAALSQAGGAAHLDQIAQALIGPTKVTGNISYGVGPDGNPVAVVKDQYGNIITRDLGGVQTVQQQNANTGATNAQTRQGMLGVAQQNAKTNAFRANTTANNSEFGNPQGTLPGDNHPSANFGGGNTLPAPSVDKIGAGNPPGSTTANPRIPRDALFNTLPPKGRQKAISTADNIVNAGTQLATTNQILDTVEQQISPYTAGTGALLKNLPGSAQADLKANLKTLAAQGLTAWINSLKNSAGQTGIGRVLQSEANAAMTLFGNMEQDQSAKQLAFHAKLFRQTVNKLYQHSQQAFRTMYGAQPHDVLNTDDPLAAATAHPGANGGLPQGWKYLGPKK